MLPATALDVGTDAGVGFKTFEHLESSGAVILGDEGFHMLGVFAREVVDPFEPSELGVSCL